MQSEYFKLLRFKRAEKIEQDRKGVVHNRVLQENITFSSPSTAANFVTGSSTNGLRAWKTEDGKPLKESLNKVSK